jgi:hypothetical protein
MPIYQNKNRDSLLFVNRKVGVTSAKAHAARGEIIFFLDPHTTHTFHIQDLSLYKIMIVRSPYLRIESFYKSKFFSDYLEKDYKISLRGAEPGAPDTSNLERYHPGFPSFEIMTAWMRDGLPQLHQLEFTGERRMRPDERDPPPGQPRPTRTTGRGLRRSVLVSGRSPGERAHAQEACKYFLLEDYFTKNINFEQFIIQGIKKGYHGHDHLYEQVRPLDQCQISVSDLNEIIKLEDPNFENLNKRFNINFVHENKSIKAEPLLWTTKMRKIVYERYKRDFEELGYEK